MNKNIILTAAVASGILAYCLQRIAKKEKKRSPAINHKNHKHLTNVFADAKGRTLGEGYR